jgi:hypothetical protein
MSLTVKSADRSPVTELQVPFSLTLLNFLEYECISDDEWVREWTTLNGDNIKNFFFFAKHIEVDRHVVGDEIDWLLKDTFIRVAAI